VRSQIISAYVLVDVLVREPDRYENYKQLAAPTVAQYDGRYVVRGGRAENLEGDWDPPRSRARRRAVAIAF